MPLKRTSEFQSTRLSRASTCRLLPYRNLPDISIHKALTSLDRILDDRKKILGNFNPQGSHEPRPKVISIRSIRFSISIHKALTSLDSTMLLMLAVDCLFQSTRLSRASTAKIHNYPCIHAKFIYLNYTPSTNHPASQKIFSYFNPIFRPFAVRIPLEFYVQLLFAPELPY